MAQKEKETGTGTKPKKKARDRGTGGLYPRGDTWWMKYYVSPGRPVRESCHTKNKAIAANKLMNRLVAIEKGELVSSDARKIKIAKLAEAFLQDYRIHGFKTLHDAESKWRLHMKDFFGHLFASSLTSDKVNEYIEKRLTEGAAKATINRELSALKRMYSIAMEATPPKVNRAPKILMLPESSPRSGFVTDDRYANLADCCAKVGLWMRAMLEVGYTFGWRSDEVKKLQVRQVEIAECRIMLDVGSTKNKDGRCVKFENGSILAELLAACCEGKSPDEYVFTRPDGKRIADFRRRWHTVCCEAGESHRVCRSCGTTVDAERFCKNCNLRLPMKSLRTIGLFFHDLRRSAARNARSAGVAEGVIMKMGGWKTRSVFDRYAIVAENDMDDAIHLIQQRRAQFGHKPPKIVSD
jgi:integrase